MLEFFLDDQNRLNSAAGFAIGGSISLIGIVITVLFSYFGIRNQVRSQYVKKVAEFRQEWIRELRDEFVSMYECLNAEGTNERVEKFWSHYAKVQLMMSRKDENFKPMNESIKGIISTLKTDNQDERMKAMAVFLTVSNDILKSEWQRVKRDLEKDQF